MEDDFIDQRFLDDVISEIAEEADALLSASPEVIMATRDAWNLRDDKDGLYSTENMTDEALEQTIVEDLLSVVYWRMQGKDVSGTREHHLRFLEGKSLERARLAFNSPMVKSLTVMLPNGSIEIHPDHMQDAMDFSGVWLEGWQPLTDDTVYRAGPRV